MTLTKKEQQVVSALRAGLVLRRKQFSDLWEVASSLVSSNHKAAKFTVSQQVVTNLIQKGRDF